VLRRLLAGLLLLAVLGGCGGGGDSGHVARTRADQARQVAKDAGLPPDVQGFLAQAATSATRTFTVHYQLADQGTSTVTQDPPRRRVEIVIGKGPTAITRLTLANDDGTFGCTRSAGIWACQKTSDTADDFGPLALGDIQQTTEDLGEARRSYRFRVESRTIAATRARCLITELKPGQPPDPTRGARGELCVSPEGVPLLIDGGTTKITAVRYETRADDSAFRLPAKPKVTG
jgi:hypothetical protein